MYSPFIRAAAFLLLLGSAAGIAGGQESNPAGANDHTFRVRVEMVTLPVVVTDLAGSTIKNLKKEDFRVFEDGVPQEIVGFAAVEEPISVALMLDVSGSTASDLRRIQDEAIRFVNTLRPADSIAILSVASEVKLLEQFNIYHKKNPDKIRQVRSGGLSAVYDGVAFALEKVLQIEPGRKALIFFSDGVDNESATTREDTMELARQTEAPIYCVYFNTDPFRDVRSSRRPKWPDYAAGREYLQDLASSSGGLLLDASKLDNLGSAFRKIAEDLASQYSIGYYPKNQKHDDQFRRIEVQVRIPGLSARTKQGYYHVQ
jgi:Ca-activated chloride channel family protein